VALFKSLAFAIVLWITPLLFAQTQPVELHVQAGTPFRFIVYGDTRFTDPTNTKAATRLPRSPPHQERLHRPPVRAWRSCRF
jgi:hypothetical protein